MDVHVSHCNDSELDRYKRFPILAVDQGKIIEWWYNHKSEFPLLYKIAKMKIHAIPATSCPSKRDFSMAGIIMSERRTRMSDLTFVMMYETNTNVNDNNHLRDKTLFLLITLSLLLLKSNSDLFNKSLSTTAQTQVIS